LTVVAAGDIAYCGGVDPAATPAARTARLVRPEDDLVLTLGDAAYESGTASEYANCFHATWGAFKDRIRPAPGNHDYLTPDAAGYFGYFGAQAGPDARGYYSFDQGGWHFISLNAMDDLAPGSAQYRWLADDLAASRGSLCTLAVLHYPAFNSGANHGSVLAMRPAFEALQQGGAELILSGHEHVFERFAPQHADGTADPERGLRHFTVGTGGHVLMAFREPLPNSEFRYNESWGVLRLTLGTGEYGWRYVNVDGVTLDTGRGTCHP
jgi:3',5'-cyclic AMP phosphodiesterase CpdA